MRYRGYQIDQNWQGNSGRRQPDTFTFVHPDYDGPEDNRYGHAPDLKQAHELIDELVREDLRDKLSDSVPPAIADFAIEVCLRFGINGSSDPMYVANIAALEFNEGNGQGVFVHGVGNKHGDPCTMLYERLMVSYSSCITDGQLFGELIQTLVKDLAGVA